MKFFIKTSLKFSYNDVNAYFLCRTYIPIISSIVTDYRQFTKGSYVQYCQSFPLLLYSYIPNLQIPIK